MKAKSNPTLPDAPTEQAKPRSVQRMVGALHRDYQRGVARMKKWTAQVQDLQTKMAAQDKDLDDIERRLDGMGERPNDELSHHRPERSASPEDAIGGCEQ